MAPHICMLTCTCHALTTVYHVGSLAAWKDLWNMLTMMLMCACHFMPCSALSGLHHSSTLHQVGTDQMHPPHLDTTP